MVSLSLVLTVLLLAVPISCDLVADICNEVGDIDNPTCHNIFYNNGSSTDVQGLDQFVIGMAAKHITETVRYHIPPVLSKTTDPKQKAVYALCTNNYVDSLAALAAAKEKLGSRDFPGVKTAADVFSRDAVSCKQAFDTAPDRPDIVTQDIHMTELYSRIIVATSRRL